MFLRVSYSTVSHCFHFNCLFRYLTKHFQPHKDYDQFCHLKNPFLLKQMCLHWQRVYTTHVEFKSRQYRRCKNQASSEEKLALSRCFEASSISYLLPYILEESTEIKGRAFAILKLSTVQDDCTCRSKAWHMSVG